MHDLTERQNELLTNHSRTIVEGIRIVLANGDVLAFTEYRLPLVVGGVTYLSRPGMQVKAISSSAGLAVDNSEAQAFFLAGVITERQVFNRHFDGAVYYRVALDYENADFVPVVFQRGFVGRFNVATPAFGVELRSLTQATSQTVGIQTSPRCRILQLGDEFCGVDLENGSTPDPAFPSSPYIAGLPYRVASATVLAVNSASADISFTVMMDDPFPTGYFNDGRTVWQSGENDETEMEVLSYTYDEDTQIGTFTLYEPLAVPIVAGDTVELNAGCDRTYTTCLFKYNALKNRRAEDYLPGPQVLVQVVGGQ